MMPRRPWWPWMVLIGLVATAPMAGADERAHPRGETRRHSTESGQQPQSAGAGLVDRDHGTISGAPADPGLHPFWSERCVEQRARGWGHTGDCDNPAYTGERYRIPYPRWPAPPYEPERQERPWRRAPAIEGGGVPYGARVGPGGAAHERAWSGSGGRSIGGATGKGYTD